MYLNELLNEKNISRYKLSKDSGVAQTTITDICSQKSRIEKCSVETIYRIAKVLNVSIESLIENEIDNVQRTSFEVYKSNVCHYVNSMNDTDFLIKTLENDEIRKLYNKKWYREAFYLLAMVDYLSRENDIPLCNKYDDIRTKKLDKIIYPKSVLLSDKISKTNKNKEKCLKNAIPEFKRYNIIESDIRNVC